MKLDSILQGVDGRLLVGSTDKEIVGVTADSRQVCQGTLFVAQRGETVDGHRFIPKAIDAGAVAVVLESEPSQLTEGVTYFITPDSSVALGVIADNYYGHPSQMLQLVGITGTNGKTTIATLLYELVRLLGNEAGLISTVANYVGSRRYETSRTTPDTLTIHRLLREMVDAGCSHCFMEVSSHSTVQHRIAGLRFAGGVFTNITHDHLDYHKTFKAYIEAKQLFFDGLDAKAFALTNRDDSHGEVMIQNTAARRFDFAIRHVADFQGKMIEQHLDSTLLSLNGTEVWSRLVGAFNASNMTAIYGTAILLGFPQEKVLEKISMLEPAPGRFDVIKGANGAVAVVDYAHTPDALEKVLTALHGVRSGSGKIITMVGCGGDRDRTKRPEMAAVVCAMSDRVFLTSDNPRTEEPAAILREMAAGIPSGYTAVSIIEDRREAIHSALADAVAGDVVLVAGKGHEDYQEINGVKHHFDDKEVIQDFFNNK